MNTKVLEKIEASLLKSNYYNKERKVTIVKPDTCTDRYEQEIHVGDKIDALRSAPGGLVRGIVASIVTVKWDEYWCESYRYNYDEHKWESGMVPAGSSTTIVMYTDGKRWTNKRQGEVIRIPNS